MTMSKNLNQLYESGEKESLKGHFRNLVVLAQSDGMVSQVESDLLERFAKKLALSWDEVERIVRHEDNYPLILPVEREERLERFIEFVQLLVEDGNVAEAETFLAIKFGIELGFTREEIEEVYETILVGCMNDEEPELIIEKLA